MAFKYQTLVVVGLMSITGSQSFADQNPPRVNMEEICRGGDHGVTDTGYVVGIEKKLDDTYFATIYQNSVFGIQELESSEVQKELSEDEINYTGNNIRLTIFNQSSENTSEKLGVLTASSIQQLEVTCQPTGRLVNRKSR